jgi:hypothetical protein
MHVNGKMISVETIPGMRERGKRRMVEGVNSSMIQSICCKNFYKCHNVPPPSTIKNERKKERQGFAVVQSTNVYLLIHNRV